MLKMRVQAAVPEMVGKLAPVSNQRIHLAAKYGPERAFNILKEGHNALEWLEEFVSTESIDCHFKLVGKFLGAHNPTQYEKLGKKIKYFSQRTRN